MKKIIALILAAAMVMSLAAVAAFADEEGVDRERPQLQRGEGFGGRGGKGGRGRNDGRGGRMAGFGPNAEAIEQAIAELDDQTKAEITALLEKYTAAADAVKAARDEKRSELDQLQQAAADARSALNEVLKNAGVELPGMPKGDRPDVPKGGFGGMRFGRLPDDDIIEEAIAALEDEAVKKELYQLLEKWNEACDAHKNAFEEDSSLTDEQKQQLAEAAKTAHQELFSSLKEAGIEISFERPERPEKSSVEKPEESTDGEKAKESAASSEAADAGQSTEPEKGGFFDNFTGWLSGLLG
ncbi:MAG: hypothetical protein IJF25_05935 [Oscillospiraceae bacterium]|nr:hypothetical protein [Oscillospiraceae bacterium]MBQ4539386.1 hypothetical protein [Oscillospiraceae bacterium]